ncbi:type I-E CRISPR-associated protein Cse1/CasA [Austwickia chelonae]|uniref:type I-E CRISPR-associated protein Cse1/CasA n=1 Tax=Austwickia chelonae TaxID=100225 RepID=UPI000E27E460|nr:type I-E CRISPR-associated protein Cse1/CasA [Austwickia chelonae]
MTPTFNLVHDPWILARDEGQRCHEVSLEELFRDISRWRGLAGEMPTQQAAVLRLLLAICHRALREDLYPDEAVEQWGEWWSEGFPTAAVITYLERFRDRFELFDARAPFLQVADLHTEKGSTSGLTKLIAEIPDGEKFFTTRAGRGLDRIGPAEAARWLIHCQAYDPAGIKSGAVGDERVKGGKGYPSGTGWCGNLGMIIAEGNTLAETLLLNLVYEKPSPEGDLPVWEREDLLSSAVDRRLSDPDRETGPVELLAWQSRRLRLFTDDEGYVVDALVCYGDRAVLQNRHGDEAMVAWRRSANQEKKGDHGPVVYMPVTHQPERAVWRGLESLLAGNSSTGGPAEEASRLSPPLLRWLATVTEEEYLGRDHPIRFRAIGIEYGSQSSVISGVIDDSMHLHAGVLTSAALRSTVIDAVAATQEAVSAVRHFAGNLQQAAGGAPEGVQERAAERAWNVLDRPFREWAWGLTAEKDAAQALTTWHRNADRLLREVGAELVDASADKAWRGREVKGHVIDAPIAEGWFRSALRKALPRAYPDPTADKKLVSTVEETS